MKECPLKVLFVLPSLAAGGAERVMITLMNSLDTNRYTPVLLTVKNNSELKDMVNSAIPVYCLSRNSILLSYPALIKSTKELKPDVIVSTMTHMNFSVLAMKPFLPQTRFIVREAITPSFFLHKHKLKVFFIRALYKILYPHADIVLSPTAKVFDEFEKNIRPKLQKSMVLPNPVDVEHIRQDEDLPEITEKRKKTVQFIACGRLHKQKGFDRLIAALAHAELPYQWHLQILGEGEERLRLETLIRESGLQNQISMPGHIKKPHKHFAAADCFLLPSRFEGLPNVVLEALACGVPVIATNEAGGIQEIAQNAPPHALKIVNDMDDFIGQLLNVKSAPVCKFRTSLLPEIYKKKSVVKSFHDILSLYWQPASTS